MGKSKNQSWTHRMAMMWEWHWAAFHHRLPSLPSLISSYPSSLLLSTSILLIKIFVKIVTSSSSIFVVFDVVIIIISSILILIIITFPLWSKTVSSPLQSPSTITITVDFCDIQLGQLPLLTILIHFLNHQIFAGPWNGVMSVTHQLTTAPSGDTFKIDVLTWGSAGIAMVYEFYGCGFTGG